ncbi:adaptor protein MecA [Bacillus marinisedimentorum]|uniref:adaptor protein MecA n=1 Tax=Bacillus marinisedimentorum TaxID=1821260 RepID=UPI0008724C92|nr:adaptor protein MecA [Bacillus marinisedimentorum]
MEIERINEYTVKFYITYKDIEDRGFDREEIWYNRERSEELFWEMMDEMNMEEDFSVEGPLWIQVQALDKGLEVMVTRAQLSNDGQKLELPVNEDKSIDIPVDDQIESLLDKKFNLKNEKEELEQEDVSPGDETLEFIIGFEDFEHVISLSHSFAADDVFSRLYVFDDNYYLYVTFPEEEFSEEEQDDLLSFMLEYGYESNITVHRMIEYGKVLMEENAIKQIREKFPQMA